MYKTFDDARRAALEVIERVYHGNKMCCVVTETKIPGKPVFYGFRFHDTDTGGAFIDRGGELVRCTQI